MIRTNLATRPFYNERAALLLLGAFALVVLLVSVLNAYRITDLTGRNRALAGRVSAAETQTDQLRRSAASIRRSIDARELAAISNAAREANAIVGARTFSWTDLFHRLETTLPAGVRIVKITPSVDDDGEMVVTIIVVARRVDDIDTFLERLEGTGTFGPMLSRRELTNEEGFIEATLEGRYGPGRWAGRKRGA